LGIDVFCVARIAQHKVAKGVRALATQLGVLGGQDLEGLPVEVDSQHEARHPGPKV